MQTFICRRKVPRDARCTQRAPVPREGPSRKQSSCFLQGISGTWVKLGISFLSAIFEISESLALTWTKSPFFKAYGWEPMVVFCLPVKHKGDWSSWPVQHLVCWFHSWLSESSALTQEERGRLLHRGHLKLSPNEVLWHLLQGYSGQELSSKIENSYWYEYHLKPCTTNSVSSTLHHQLCTVVQEEYSCPLTCPYPR